MYIVITVVVGLAILTIAWKKIKVERRRETWRTIEAQEVEQDAALIKATERVERGEAAYFDELAGIWKQCSWYGLAWREISLRRQNLRSQIQMLLNADSEARLLKGQRDETQALWSRLLHDTLSTEELLDHAVWLHHHALNWDVKNIADPQTGLLLPTYPRFRDMAQDFLERRCQELHEQVLAGGGGFSELHQLLLHRQEKYRQVTFTPVTYPDDWNELVAQHYADPKLSDFLPESDTTTGQLRLRGATALQQRDLVEALIVLSYINRYPVYQQALGPMMSRDLALMVAQLRLDAIARANTPTG